MLLKQVADAFAASRHSDSASLSRLAFWVDTSVIAKSSKSPSTTSTMRSLDLRSAVVCLYGGRRHTEPSGQPLKGSTINRYVSTLGSVCRFARRARLVARKHVTTHTGPRTDAGAS